MRLLRVVLLTLLPVLTLGCVNNPMEPPPQPMAMVAGPPEVDIITMSHTMADALVGELRKNHPNYHKQQPMLLTTFVDLKNLERSSELGMVIADQVGSRFTQHGYSVVETRMRSEISVRERQGEFILSRDISKLSQSHQAYGVIVGHYTVTSGIILITAQVIRVGDSQILASINAKVPVAGVTRDLLVDTDCCASIRMVGK